MPQIPNRPRVEVPDTGSEDPRIGHYLERPPSDHPKVVLIGFPVDEGVFRNGGRTGAAMAPDTIRQNLYRLSPDAEDGGAFASLLDHVYDWGNIRSSGNLEVDQAALGEAVSSYLSEGVIPIILGGGHETAYGHFLGYVESGIENLTVLNWDAHTDVRELRNSKGHSGSSFRQILLHPSDICRQYLVAGLLPYSASKAHLEFILERGGTIHWRKDLTSEEITRIYSDCHAPLMASFDIDAVSQWAAPGVSSPCMGGMDPVLWLEAAHAAGASGKVTSMDLAEVNPQYDNDNQTSRLAALTVWHFLKGLSESIEEARP